MSVTGVSLVGFMQEAEAVSYLGNQCVCGTTDPAALAAIWKAARKQLGLGTATPNAGRPKMSNLPAGAAAHVAKLEAEGWFQNVLGTIPGKLAHDFKLVELAPLLTFQTQVMTAHADGHCAHLSVPPTLDELLALTLPLSMPDEPWQSGGAATSITLISGLNARTQAYGPIGENTMMKAKALGILFGPTFPVAHIKIYNGRAYLDNGFHRLVGLIRAGVTEAPLLVVDVGGTPDGLGAHRGGGFGVPFLEAPNPPTLAHYAPGRAYELELRKFRRVTTVTWTDALVEDV